MDFTERFRIDGVPVDRDVVHKVGVEMLWKFGGGWEDCEERLNAYFLTYPPSVGGEHPFGLGGSSTTQCGGGGGQSGGVGSGPQDGGGGGSGPGGPQGSLKDGFLAPIPEQAHCTPTNADVTTKFGRMEMSPDLVSESGISASSTTDASRIDVVVSGGVFGIRFRMKRVPQFRQKVVSSESGEKWFVEGQR